MRKLKEAELTAVSGGINSGSQSSVKAVGNPYRMPCKQVECPRCGSTALADQRFSMDNGRSVYEGQECSACGNVLIYGNDIM